MTNPSTITVSSRVEAVSEEQAYQIGIEAYWYFYPLITMELTRRQSTNMQPGKKPGFGPANAFTHMRAYPDANFRSVVRPNFDTLYSTAWLDLTGGPVVINVPDTAGRYYLLPMLDMWTDVFASPGWRTSGTGAHCYAIVPPGWSGSLPAEVERIDAPTGKVWVVGRIKTDGPTDYAAVHAVQDRLSITPLSSWGKSSPAVEATIDPTVDMATPPLESVNKMTAGEYFAMAAELLKLHSPHASDWSLLARMRRVGIEPGRNFELKSLPAAIATALSSAAQDALKLMTARVKTVGSPLNGWIILNETMGVYGNSYLKRAVVAMIGLGANQPEDAVYPLNVSDAEGKAVTAEKNYVLHFGMNELPPVDAFWSLTLYDTDGFQVANTLNRYAVSSWMPLKKNTDGSLDIYVQHENPGTDRESNWLPSPAAGNLGLTMRLYAPRPQVLSGDWHPPAIKKVN
jgi:hypothetical protein